MLVLPLHVRTIVSSYWDQRHLLESLQRLSLRHRTVLFPHNIALLSLRFHYELAETGAPVLLADVQAA